MSNESRVQDAIETIWNRGELDRVEEFYGPEFVCHQPELGLRWDPGPEGVRRIVTRTRARFPDYRETIEDVIASRDRVVLRLTNRGTDTGGTRSAPPSGRTFEAHDYMIARVADGKIVEQWSLIDLYSMYVQLGMIEPLSR